jgi:hypothetical protein
MAERQHILRNQTSQVVALDLPRVMALAERKEIAGRAAELEYDEADSGDEPVGRDPFEEDAPIFHDG